MKKDKRKPNQNKTNGGERRRRRKKIDSDQWPSSVRVSMGHFTNAYAFIHDFNIRSVITQNYQYANINSKHTREQHTSIEWEIGEYRK